MRVVLAIAIMLMLLPVPITSNSHKASKEVIGIFGSGEEQANVIIKLKQSSASGNAKGLTVASSVRETGRISQLNILSATITKDELAMLESDPNVEAVYYNFPVYATLDQSVPLVNADDIFSITYNGTQINGSGYSVCVVDTGVNYSHPALGGCTEEQFLNGSCQKVIGGYDVYNNDANPMDDHGHGTHVAGIVASTDSTYRGVAPGASIVALKALGAGGSGTYFDIIEAMQWCLSNASRYNITAISMSLGDGSPVSSYCDSGDPLLSGLINNSVAAGIPVVVATGNEYSTTGVSWPACLAQATRVSATTKSDVIAVYANRGAGFPDIIMAPGSNIMSANISTGFVQKSGTSMATPHVSGAIALMRDYWEHVNNATLSPAEIKERLNYTKVRIDDTGGSGLYYPRLDVLEAVRPHPAFAAPTPANASSTTQYFIVNVTSPTPLSSAVLELTYPNSTRINFTMPQNSPYSFSMTAPTVQFGQYNLTVFTNDSANTSGFPVSRSNVTVVVSVSLDSPASGYAQNTSTFTLNCSFSTFERNASSITLYGNFTGAWAANQTVAVSGNETNASFTLDVPPGTYAWNCYGMDEYGTGFFAPQNYTFAYDPYPPTITPLSPSVLEVLDRNSTLNASALIADEVGVSYAYVNLSLPNGTVLMLELTNTSSVQYSNITTVPDIGCMHNITFYANDSFGNANQSEISYLARPCHTLSTTSVSIKTNTATPLNITVSLAVPSYGFLDNYTLTASDTMHASPSSVILGIAPGDEKQANFTLAYAIPGNYSLTINSTQSAFPMLWDALGFQCEVVEAPAIAATSIMPYISFNGSSIHLNATVTPNISVWANITKPDGWSETVLLPVQFTNTSLIGRYNVTFIANDSWSTATSSDYFEIYEGVLLNTSVYGPADAGTPARVSLYYRSVQVAENSSLDGNQTLYVPNASGYVISISDYTGSITAILEGAAINFADTFRFGLYNSTEWSLPGRLASYGLENATPFENATVRIYYTWLPYTNEAQLRLYKCSSWDFENRRCLGNGWDITANSTQDLTADYFEVSGTTLGGFAIVQGPWCGDGFCNGGETCSACPADCGICPGGGSGGGSGGSSGGVGSGGGSGGGSAILPKDARYKNITSLPLFVDLAPTNNETIFVGGEQYEPYYKNGTFCGLRRGTSIINSTEEVSEIFGHYVASFGTPESLRTAVLDGLQEFNSSRTAEIKCRNQFGHHLFPCINEESCLRGCRLVPLCSPLSYSEIVLNMSGYLYMHSEELSRTYDECAGLAANASTYEDLSMLKWCVQKVSDESVAISSSPLFGNCSTCLSVCPDTNYLYSGLVRVANAITNATRALQATNRSKAMLSELGLCLAQASVSSEPTINGQGEIIIASTVQEEPPSDSRVLLHDALFAAITTALLLYLGKMVAMRGTGSGGRASEVQGGSIGAQPQQ